MSYLKLKHSEDAPRFPHCACRTHDITYFFNMLTACCSDSTCFWVARTRHRQKTRTQTEQRLRTVCESSRPCSLSSTLTFLRRTSSTTTQCFPLPPSSHLHPRSPLPSPWQPLTGSVLPPGRSACSSHWGSMCCRTGWSPARLLMWFSRTETLSMREDRGGEKKQNKTCVNSWQCMFFCSILFLRQVHWLFYVISSIKTRFDTFKLNDFWYCLLNKWIRLITHNWFFKYKCDCPFHFHKLKKS